MNLPEQRSDEDLATSLQQGDASASATLAQRYAPGIYDFAIRITLDPAAAGHVTENTLKRVSSEIASRPSDLSFAAWLFGVARDESLEGLRQRSRGDSSPDEVGSDALAPMDPRFIQVSGSVPSDSGVWAWSAARGQRPRDYSILDLLLRRKITPEEVAQIASLSRNGVYAVLGRLRGAFEESFIATALFTSGRAACKDLDALLGDSISLGPAMRREVSRHAESCPICKDTRAKLPAGADVFASLEDVALPDDVSDRLLPYMLAAGGAATSEIASQPDAENGLEVPGMLAAGGALAAAAGFAANGDESAEAASDALAAEADTPTLEVEEAASSAASQVSLFESEADTTAADLTPVSEPDAVEDLIEDEPDEEAAVEPEAAEDPIAVQPASGDTEDLLDEEADESSLDSADDVAIAGLAAAIVTEDEAEDDFASEDSLPRPAFVGTADEPEEEAIDLDDAATSYDARTNDNDADEDADYVQDDTPEGETTYREPVAAYADDDDEEEDTLDDSPVGAVAASAGLAAAATYDDDEPEEEDDAAQEPAAMVFGEPERGEARNSAGSEAAAGGLLASTAVASENLKRRRQSMQAGRGGNPPAGRGPFGTVDLDDGRNKKKYFLYAVGLGLTLVALYIGIALGDSLRGGGGGDNGSNAAALPTRQAGLTDAACPGPVSLNQGGRVALTFSNIPAGFELLASPGVRPVSPTSAVGQVSATSQAGNTILFVAATVPNSAGRTDEYQITATFGSGSERQAQQCVVRVLGPAGTPVATATAPVPTPATPAVTNTVPPAPTATTAPIIQPTSVPTSVPTAVPTAEPTATPDLSTATPSVPTVVPTAGGTVLSPTETPIPPATQTPTPTP